MVLYNPKFIYIFGLYIECVERCYVFLAIQRVVYIFLFLINGVDLKHMFDLPTNKMDINQN